MRLSKKYKRIKATLIALFIVSIVLIIAAIIAEISCNFFDDTRYIGRELIGVFMALFQTALMGIFIKNEFREHEIITQKSLDLESKGIIGVNKEGRLSSQELNDLFSKADVIKLMFVCGKNFLSSNEKVIKKALNAKKKIRILIATENSDFVNEITAQLDALKSKENQKENNQNQEIRDVIALIDKWREETHGDIELRHFNTEYRVPYYIGYYDKEKVIKAWYNSIIPVSSPRDMIMFYGEAKYAQRDEYYVVDPANSNFDEHNYVADRISSQKRENIVFDLEAHFDYLWNKNTTE